MRSLAALLTVAAMMVVIASREDDSQEDGSEMPKFAYLVQVPDNSESLASFGGEDSDVYILYWRTAPTEMASNELFVPKSSWNSGRNRLLEAARASGKDYLYYIFADHDLDLVEVRDYGKNTGDPFRTFERYLMEWQPAVGLVEYQGQHCDPAQEVQVLYGFDGVFNAYHREVVDFLLPYTEHFDSESWWYSMFCVMTLSAAYFNNHRLQFNALRVNPGHSIGHFSYPHEIDYDRPFDWLLPAITDEDAIKQLRMDTHDENISYPLGGQPEMYPGTYIIDTSRYHSCHAYFFRANRRYCAEDRSCISYPCDDTHIETSTGITVHVEIATNLLDAEAELRIDSLNWSSKLAVSNNGLGHVHIPQLPAGEHVATLVVGGKKSGRIVISVAEFVPELHPQPKVWYPSPRGNHVTLRRHPISRNYGIKFVISNFNMPQDGYANIYLDGKLGSTTTLREMRVVLPLEPGQHTFSMELVDKEGNVIDENMLYFAIPMEEKEVAKEEL